MRNKDIDIYKGQSMLLIILWHFEFIPTYYMIYAIPIFVFATAALYHGKWEAITIQKLAPKIIWVAGIIIGFTLLAYVLRFPTYSGKETPEIQWNLYFFFMRNPWFGHLWYFLLYFQILGIFYFLHLLKQKTGKFFPNIEHWTWGIVAFLFSQAVSLFLLWRFGKGLSIQVFSWTFVVWLGLFHFDKIYSLVKKTKSISLFTIILVSAICITMIFFFGGQPLLSFLVNRKHDFIFPTFVLQSLYFIILCCSVTLLTRSILVEKLLYPLELVGKYSLYFYVFHAFFYQGLFSCRPYHELSYKMLALSVTLVSCGFLGVLLEQFRRKQFSPLFVRKPIDDSATFNCR